MTPSREPNVGEAVRYRAVSDPPGAHRNAIVGRLCGEGCLDLRVKFGTNEEGEISVRNVGYDPTRTVPRSWSFPDAGS